PFRTSVLLFFHCSCVPPALHSFPTRRSSDLAAGYGLDSGGTLLARRTLLVLTLLLAFIAMIPGPALADEGGNPASVYFPQTGHKDRKSTRLNSSHVKISYAVFCLKKKKQIHE